MLDDIDVQGISLWQLRMLRYNIEKALLCNYHKRWGMHYDTGDIVSIYMHTILHNDCDTDVSEHTLITIHTEGMWE